MVSKRRMRLCLLRNNTRPAAAVIPNAVATRDIAAQLSPVPGPTIISPACARSITAPMSLSKEDALGVSDVGGGDGGGGGEGGST